MMLSNFTTLLDTYLPNWSILPLFIVSGMVFSAAIFYLIKRLRKIECKWGSVHFGHTTSKFCGDCGAQSTLCKC